MFRTRLLSGILLMIIALVTLITGGNVLFFILLLISLIGMTELYKVFGIEKKPPGLIGYIAALAYYGLVYFEAQLPGEKQTWFMLLFMAFLICEMAALVFAYPKYDTQQIRAYLTHIYVSMIQLADASIISKYLDGITKITTLTSLREIINLLRSTAADIMSAMQFHIQHQQNELIKKVTGYVDEHLTDNHLTLSFIAHKLLYVNVDYLGKLFNAEYGEKFSAYLTRRRVELAASMLLDGAIPINEIALKCGFGYNSQYFSKVFKKSTGYTPTEYRTKFSGFSS